MAMKIQKSPPVAPGHQVVDMLRDAMRMAVTAEVPYSATSPATVTVARVPANTLIFGVLAEVTTAFTASSGALTMSLGDSDAASCLAALTSDDLESTGMKGLATVLGKNYTADQDIIATFANSTSNSLAGAVRFWLLYRTDSNKQLAAT